MRAWPHLDVLWQIGTEEADGDGEETGCHAICCSDMNWYPCRRATTHTHTHTHTPLRVILTLVYPHMHKHPSELWHTMPPHTIPPSPLVSMMCAAEALANCQRLCARLRSERREDAEGFDRETALRLMVGWWEPQHRLLQRDAPPLMYCTCQQAVLFTELLS